MFKFLAISFVLVAGAFVFAAPVAPLALVYQGPGACESCSKSAFEMATLAGFRAQFVGPNQADEKLFAEAKVYLQPGGRSIEAAKAMSPKFMDSVRYFVKNGGGYVGYCAGAFIATAEIRDEGVAGFAIFPGRSWLWLGVSDNPNIISIRWDLSQREMFWEGGPSMDLSQVDLVHKQVDVVATYPDGKIAAARTYFGRGRVFLAGVHPEASQFWRDAAGLQDRDGLDWDLAIGMIKWSAGLIK